MNDFNKELVLSNTSDMLKQGEVFDGWQGDSDNKTNSLILNTNLELIELRFTNQSGINGTMEWNNSSGNVSDIRDKIMEHPATQIIFFIQYFTIFVLGVFGNCLVCYVVFRSKHMQTVTNFFIANLALADILLCIFAVPFTPAYFFMKEWVFGRVLCYLLSWSQGVSVYVSTLTLTSIAIDRFFVIIYPFRSRLRLNSCYLIIVCIWIFSLSATLPYALYMDELKFKGKFYCEELWPSETIRQVYSLFTTVMQFVIPFLVILFCYVKIFIRMSQRGRFVTKFPKKDEAERERKKRTNRMLIAMVSIFGISWLPFNLFHLIQDYSISTGEWKYISFIFFITHVVAMSSTCYNPFLYAWLNENFRKEFQVVLPCFNQNPSNTFHRGQWRSERTCNGNNETQMETIRDNISSLNQSPAITQDRLVDTHPTDNQTLAKVEGEELQPISSSSQPMEEQTLNTYLVPVLYVETCREKQRETSEIL